MVAESFFSSKPPPPQGGTAYQNHELTELI
jgi:hypothetical protein